jgi:hypothetical protein
LNPCFYCVWNKRKLQTCHRKSNIRFVSLSHDASLFGRLVLFPSKRTIRRPEVLLPSPAAVPGGPAAFHSLTSLTGLHWFRTSEAPAAPHPHPPLRRLSPLNPLRRRASPSPRCHFSQVALLHLLVWRRRLANPTPSTAGPAAGIPQNLLEKVILALNSNPYPPSPSAVVGVRGEERRCDTAERQGRPGRAQPTKWESKR